jgi:hypothetical protein
MRHASQYGKPLVIEEFGKTVPLPNDSDGNIKNIRDPWYSVRDLSIHSATLLQEHPGPVVLGA